MIGGRARAAFGEFPANQLSVQLPEERRVKNVLELFLYGGLSPWETFYLVDEYGAAGSAAPGTQFHTFLGGGPGSVENALTRCGLALGGPPYGTYFADDGAGVPVGLGPFLSPLTNRTDLTERMRVLVQQHNLEPHEGAIPLGLTGKRVGAPTMTGLGAHIQRARLDGFPRRTPHAYVIESGGFTSDNVQAAMATGIHPGSSRPLGIKIDQAGALSDLLSRPAIPTTRRDAYDALVAKNIERYGQRLTRPGAIEPLASKDLRSLDIGASLVASSSALQDIIQPNSIVVTDDQVCNDYNFIDAPEMGLKLAVELLQHPTDAPSYVCVVDTGLLMASGGGGYDTHTNHCRDAARNLKNLLDGLTAKVNAPGETDPTKLSLDDTLIVINTEFGRTPWAQDGGNGRNHHPRAYTTAFIGGPTRAGEHGIVGAIDDVGDSSDFLLPSENRIAIMLALGLFPFSPEAFAVSDVQNAVGEQDAIAALTSRVFGIDL